MTRGPPIFIVYALNIFLPMQISTYANFYLCKFLAINFEYRKVVVDLFFSDFLQLENPPPFNFGRDELSSSFT